jgi:hypothetical protein
VATNIHMDQIILCFVYPDDHKATFVYSSLRKDHLSSSYIIDLDPFPSSEPYEDHDVHILIPPEDDPSCKPVHIGANPLPHAITAINCIQPTEVQSRIK